LIAYRELARVVQPGDIILAAGESSNRIPAWAVMRVVVGPGSESMNSKELTTRVSNFYGCSNCSSEQTEFVNEFSIDYVFFGPNERKLGDWVPDPARYLALVKGEFSIYQVLQQPVTP
jgi:hypothetical protein